MVIAKPFSGRWLTWTAAGSVFLFPGLVATVDHAGSLLFVLLLLVGFAGCKGGWRDLGFWEKAMLLGMLTFFAVCALSLANAEDLKNGFSRLEKVARLLALIPIYLTLRQLNVSLVRPFFWGCLWAGPWMLAVSFYQAVIETAPRSAGAYHPIVFGDQAVLIAGVLGASLCFSPRSRMLWVLTLLSLGSALIASGLSGSRGGWLALPILVALYLWFFRSSLAHRVRVLVLAVFFVTAAGVMVSHNPVRERITHAYEDIVNYRSGDKVNTSLGSRFLLWDLAIDIWKEHPLMGTGLGDYSHDIDQIIDAGETRLNTVWPHAHSIYFELLATTGLVGLLALVGGLFVVPSAVYFRKIQAGKMSSVTFPMAAGLGCLLSFAVFGLSEAWTARSPLLTSYVVCLLVFSSGMYAGPDMSNHVFDSEPMKEPA